MRKRAGWHPLKTKVLPPENKKHVGKETKIWTKPSSFWGFFYVIPLGRLATTMDVLGLSFSPRKSKSPPELGRGDRHRSFHYTLPKTNIAPENGPSQNETSKFQGVLWHSSGSRQLKSSEAISNNKLPDSAWRTRSIRESFLQVIELRVFMDYPRRSIYPLVVGHPKRKVVLWSMITIYKILISWRFETSTCGNIEGVINHCY